MRGEGGVQTNVRRGIERTEAVGPNDPDAGIAADLEQLPLPSRSFLADLGESGRDHQHRPHAGGGALARNPDHPLGGDDDHSQLDPSGDLADRAVRGQRLDDIRLLVDRVDRAVEFSRQEVVKDLSADGPAPA